jgi:DNA-binding transcriptional MerR regulator
MEGWTVGDVARLSDVSVRTLRHYDEIGLLRPSRTASGYRRYDEDDLSRLRQILFYRELDFGLEEIAEILADPQVDVDTHLRRQHRLLRERLERTEALLKAIENEMEAQAMGISLTPEEQLEVFGTTRVPEYEEEARERWGNTEAWQQSQRRAAAYTKEDWVAIKAEADENVAAFARALQAGEPADGAQALALAEAHRQHISRWFYDCSHEMHAGLAELYVSDPRFTAHYERHAPGLAAYVHDAFVASARHARG